MGDTPGPLPDALTSEVAGGQALPPVFRLPPPQLKVAVAAAYTDAGASKVRQ